MTTTTPAAPSRPGRRAPGGVSSVASGRVVAGLAAGAALGAALAGCHPAGWGPVDALITAAFAVVITLAASRARPWAWVVLVLPCLVVTNGLLVVGAAALVVTAVAVVRPPPRRWQGALVGALAVQVLLRLPDDALIGTTAAHPLPARLTAGLVLVACGPVLVSAWQTLGRSGRRVVRRAGLALVVAAGLATMGLAVAAFSARGGIHRGVQHAERGLDAAESGDQARALEELDAAAEGFDQAHRRLTAPWAWPARLVPVVGHYAANATVASDAGLEVMRSARRSVQQAPYDRLAPESGQVDLGLLQAMATPVSDTAAALVRADERVGGLDDTWLLPMVDGPLRNLRENLHHTIPEAQRVAAAVRLAPSMLGADGTRHYLVLFANPAESRFLGGYVGAYAELTADAGKVSMSASGRTADLAGSPTQPATGVEAFDAAYGRFFTSQHLGNVSASPDFPTVAQVAARLYPAVLGHPVDGVFYVDPGGLAALLKITGPITVAGLEEPLTEHDVADFLLRDQYLRFGDRADRFDFLAEASRETFHLLTSAKLPEPRRVFKALGPAVRQGRLRFVAFDPAVAELLDQIGLSGGAPLADGRDLLAVRSSNASPNKTDAFLKRQVDYQATVDAGTGQVTSTVTIRLTNGAPVGLPSYVLGNRDLMEGRPDPRPLGSNTDYLAVSSGLSLQGAELDGRPLAMETRADTDSDTYSAYVTIPAGATVEVRLHLAGTVSIGDGYRLVLAHQPLAADDAMTVRVEGGATPFSESFDLVEDRTIAVGTSRP